MLLEIGIPDGCKMSTRFCWVCGIVGRYQSGWLFCDRHPEGIVKWCAYEREVIQMPVVDNV